MEWPKRCNSEQFDKACEQYDGSDIVTDDIVGVDTECEIIYVSSLLRSKETAKRMFPGNEYRMLDVAEVPLKSFTDTAKQMPLWIWNIMGRLQWYFNNGRQDEAKIETIKRCERVIEEIENRKSDCVVVTHGFFMKTFINRLKKHGYSISGATAGYSNLQVIEAGSGGIYEHK